MQSQIHWLWTSQTISLSLGSDITCVNGPRMTLEGHEWPCYIIVVPVLKIDILLFFEEHRTNRSRVICPACFRISKILLNLRKYRIYSTLITWFESCTTHDQTMKWTLTSWWIFRMKSLSQKRLTMGLFSVRLSNSLLLQSTNSKLVLANLRFDVISILSSCGPFWPNKNYQF